MGLHNQSFARVMEQRLAQLFMMSQQQGRRFKRATTLGSYTVQVGMCEAIEGRGCLEEMCGGVPVVAQWLTNPTRNHGVSGSIPDLAQWVIDPAFPIWSRSQMRLRSGVVVAVA